MLVRPDHAAVDAHLPDHLTDRIRFGLDLGEQAAPGPILLPAHKPGIHRPPRAIPLRHIAPRRARAHLKQDAVEHVAMVTPLLATPAIPSRSGSTVAQAVSVISPRPIIQTPSRFCQKVVGYQTARPFVRHALMEAVEAWAIEYGCEEMRLTSAAHRIDAHAFYERLGYNVERSQLVLARSIVSRRTVE